jgi:acyl transferase domain-containing protein
LETIKLIFKAGIPFDKVVGSDAAVFIGSSCRDYSDILLADTERTELYQITGTGQTMLSNRISYFFDLRGPSVTIDTGIPMYPKLYIGLTSRTACSSSLVALHLACNAIRSGESKLAIFGGSNLILEPAPMIAMTLLRYAII